MAIWCKRVILQYYSYMCGNICRLQLLLIKCKEQIALKVLRNFVLSHCKAAKASFVKFNNVAL